MPTSPKLWARLPIAHESPALSGTLAEQVEQVVPLVTAETVVVGHDMGGVVAAMAALRVRPRLVVLSGTALGPYWAMVRATAWPGLWRAFYQRHGGTRFVAGAVAKAREGEALAEFPGADPLTMRRIATSMRPPAGLPQQLAKAAPVALLWGSHDRWYPPAVAHALARGTGAKISWIDGGHFSMWEAPEAYGAALGELLTSRVRGVTRL